ncbi:periplasmic protein YceI [Geotalea daltonii FRC-32]|uniref:Periplasmic protein YceI n=1 Tax=Geotalea daltonii (strain DSM 22248 / JCM 15807 / FRC-32) TaxID=316067 RepID=B9LYZ5_GEODF|nr:YceI family protein [Geotalea daltonii]ACM18727.1 periplasmic protein YceI [Geotalea daltonii FRC-32]
MKRIVTSIAAIIALSLPVIASASSWKIDADHSNVGFKVRHLMVSNVKGSFEKVAGVLELNDKDITKSKVDVTIDTASINTNAAKRDEHLRSADFFDVAKYPTMTFVSKSVAKAGKKLKVTGNLTLHGVTRPVVLDVDALTKESKDPWGNFRRGTTATTTINRKDFGLVWNAALETGGVAVGEEIAIILEIELIKNK